MEVIDTTKHQVDPHLNPFPFPNMTPTAAIRWKGLGSEKTAIEPERNCGYRVVGGLYLVCDGPGIVCRKMPWNLDVCPVCGQGIHFARGWTWIDPRKLTGGACLVDGCPLISWRPGSGDLEHQAIKDPSACPFEQWMAGLLWVGAAFYTPESFASEALSMGISKRIWSVPRGFQLGQTWVFLAHKKAGRQTICQYSKKGYCRNKYSKKGYCRHKDNAGDRSCDGLDTGCYSYQAEIREVPALFYAFRPTRLELLVNESEFDRLRQAGAEDDLKAMTKGGLITLVPVPDDDPDHHMGVYEQLKARNQKALEKRMDQDIEDHQKKLGQKKEPAPIDQQALADEQQQKAELAAQRADETFQAGVDD